MVSIEDGFDQDDWDAWTKMNAAVTIQLVGLVLQYYFDLLLKLFEKINLTTVELRYIEPQGPFQYIRGLK